MQKNSLAFVFLFVFMASCISKKEEDSNLAESKLKSKLDSLGQAILEDGKILGFSISIDSAGKTWYNGSFGYTDAEKTKPVVRETRFDIASISKLIGVSVIMKLAEQGKLNLDQTLSELLPQFPEKDQAQKIKLKHLISHTSGLQDYALEIDSIFMQTGIVPAKQDFLNFFVDKELIFEPGSNYQYCNSGFMMMAFIAENVTNKTWQQLLNEFINKPSGMDFQLIKFASDLPQLSAIFDLADGEFRKMPTWVYVIGDGGITATSEMLSKFPNYWSNGDIINQASFQKMSTPTMLNDNTPTGYGFGVRRGQFFEEPVIGHTGGWKSTYAIMSYFPKRNLTFAGLMNTDGTPSNMSKIYASYISLLFNKTIPDYKSSVISVTDPSRFVGEYHGYDTQFDTSGHAITIKLNEEKRLLYCMGEYCEPLVHIGENKFWLESYPYDYIEFQPSDNGSFSALREYYYGFFQVLRVKIDN